MTPIGPKETARMIFRIGIFKRRGLSENEANTLADQLLERDYDRDGRRSCYECSQYQKFGTCFAKQQGWIKHDPIRDRLHVCEGFEWQTP